MAETTAAAGAGLPSQAAWEHVDARLAFEVTFLATTAGGLHLEGSTSGVEDGRAWVVRYAIDVDDRWRTRRAEAWGRTASGPSHRLLETDGEGRWSVDGTPMGELDGCLDVDLEASACTNTLAVHRLALPVGGAAEAPAAYVRADGLAVERLEQRYDRPRGPEAAPGGASGPDGLRLHYVATRFDYDATLVFDAQGLVLDYPGLARRALVNPSPARDAARGAGPFGAWLDGTLAVLRDGAEADVPCDGCTACCESSQFVLVEPDENDARAHLPADLLFPAPRAPQGYSVIPYDDHGRCPMLGPDGCSIYEHRPRTCRAYDCRVLSAAGVDVGPEKPAIRRRVAEWSFGDLSADDHEALEAIRRAAGFLDRHGEDLPGGPLPPTQRAALAVDVHPLFLPAVEPGVGEVVVALRRRA